MSQAVKNRFLVVFLVSVAAVILVCAGAVAWLPVLVGPTIYATIACPNDTKLYPSLPKRKEKLTLEQKADRKFQDWLMTDIPDPSSVWDEEADQEWGRNRFHVELVKDKDWFASRRVDFLHGDITKEQLEEDFDLAREHVDVTMWKYEVEKQKQEKEEAKRRAERHDREMERRRQEREKQIKEKVLQKKRDAAARELQKKMFLAKEHQRAKAVQRYSEKAEREMTWTYAKSKALLEEKLRADKAKLSNLRRSLKHIETFGSPSSTPANNLALFYKKKIKVLQSEIARGKKALTRLEAKYTIVEDDLVLAAQELGVEVIDGEIVG